MLLVDGREDARIEIYMTAQTHSVLESVLLGSIDSDIQTLQRDGIVARRGAFPRDFVEQMREDMMTAFWEAIQHPGRAVSRGPRRWYVEVHPQAISGFTELVTHPWFVAMCEGALGPDYKVVEIGFDTPFQGAKVRARESLRRDPACSVRAGATQSGFEWGRESSSCPCIGYYPVLYAQL